MNIVTTAPRFYALSFLVLLIGAMPIKFASAQLIEITGFQPTEQSQEIVIAEHQPVQPRQQEWGVEANPTEIYTPIETFNPPQSQVEIVHEFGSAAGSRIFQESIPPDFVAQSSDAAIASGWPNTIVLKDVGYAGPGDMRAHLWRDHSTDLEANEISRETLMSMPMASVQKWHNYFHGTELVPPTVGSTGEAAFPVDDASGFSP